MSDSLPPAVNRRTRQVRALARELDHYGIKVGNDPAQWVERQIRAGRIPRVGLPLDPNIVKMAANVATFVYQGGKADGALATNAMMFGCGWADETKLRADIAKVVSNVLPIKHDDSEAASHVNETFDSDFSDSERTAAKLLSRESRSPILAALNAKAREMARRAGKSPNDLVLNLVTSAVEASKGHGFYASEELASALTFADEEEISVVDREIVDRAILPEALCRAIYGQPVEDIIELARSEYGELNNYADRLGIEIQGVTLARMAIRGGVMSMSYLIEKRKYDQETHSHAT